jgi:hypothetical protein
MRRSRRIPRGQRAIMWIEEYCIVPDGPSRGKKVLLSAAERAQVRAIYDGGQPAPVAAPLAAFLVLLHTCGHEWQAEWPTLETMDPWTVWRCASEELRAVLRRDGQHILCPELGTSYPARAA